VAGWIVEPTRRLSGVVADLVVKPRIGSGRHREPEIRDQHGPTGRLGRVAADGAKLTRIVPAVPGQDKPFRLKKRSGVLKGQSPFEEINYSRVMHSRRSYVDCTE